MSVEGFSNYAAYLHPKTGLPQIGSLDQEQSTIRPLSLASGTPLQNLYQVIEAGQANIVAAGSAIPRSSVTLLPPISGRDVLAVGKNYMEHAKEFNSSGFDSSDKVDRPSHPVIFTKRHTSIIADGEEIFPHPGFTETADYEGEIGLIIGKPGFRIREEDAWGHVWGYTIINDMTARERQRDHKQFYIGKSPDTFCPMGPAAVPKEFLPQTLRVQTHVNGELRQSATTEDLIFSIPTLIRTMSEGQTFQAGDVLATGTPAGVGIGRKPPVYLNPGDEVTVSIEGIGSLRNKIAATSAVNATVSRIDGQSAFQLTNGAKSISGKAGLTEINSKPIHYQKIGQGTESIVFVHGLGGTKEVWPPLISALSLEQSASLHLYDLEGHGLSPTHPLSSITIQSLAADLAGVFHLANASPESPATLVTHSMSCLVAFQFVLDNPQLVKKLVLLGPPPSPLPEAGSKANFARAELARTKGMDAVVDAVVTGSISETTKKTNPLAIAAARMSLLSQDPEAYAKACSALAQATNTFDVKAIEVPTLIITGDEDKVSPPSLCEKYSSTMANARHVVLPKVGHWHVFEDVQGVAENLKTFL